MHAHAIRCRLIRSSVPLSDYRSAAAAQPAAPTTPLCEHLIQRTLRREVAAESVNAAAWRRRRRADVDAFERRRVGPPGRPCEELADIDRASADVAPDDVR